MCLVYSVLFSSVYYGSVKTELDIQLSSPRAWFWPWSRTRHGLASLDHNKTDQNCSSQRYSGS